MEACLRCLWCKSLMINNSVSARRHLPGLDVSILCSLWCYDKYRCFDQSGKSAWIGQGTWDDENENRRCALLSHPALEMTACTEWLSSVRLVEVCKWKQPPMFFVTQYLRKSYQNTVMPCCLECFAASPLHLRCLWTCPRPFGRRAKRYCRNAWRAVLPDSVMNSCQPRETRDKRATEVRDGRSC